MEYSLSSSWTKRNKKYIPNFSEEWFLKQNKNSQFGSNLETVSCNASHQNTFTLYFKISLTEISEELWSHSYCQLGLTPVILP
jgi:hypothetical protein